MNQERERIGTGTPWEAIAGYSRAVRDGDRIWVSGTTATDAAGKVVGGTAGDQARACLRNIEDALTWLDAGLEDVVRTRMFVTNAADWEAVARVHGEVFRDIRPASTLVIVTALVDPAMLVEIEVEAVVRR